MSRSPRTSTNTTLTRSTIPVTDPQRAAFGGEVDDTIAILWPLIAQGQPAAHPGTEERPFSQEGLPAFVDAAGGACLAGVAAVVVSWFTYFYLVLGCSHHFLSGERRVIAGEWRFLVYQRFFFL